MRMTLRYCGSVARGIIQSLTVGLLCLLRIWCMFSSLRAAALVLTTSCRSSELRPRESIWIRIRLRNLEGKRACINLIPGLESSTPVYRTSSGVVSYAINTATGAGFEQVQAFPALAHLTTSAAEAVGMYGNIYDITMLLRNTAANTRTVTVTFSSLSSAQISRLWDGVGLVDGELLPIQHVPGQAVTVLKTLVLGPSQSRTVHFKTVVPGLTSLPQALSVAYSDADATLV
mmetsp:Transcript_83195/g.222352  ORF Transcript_83195/g.222352 Transcript_83195/m.222352 type:complete len:231 (+) Transcript_83195:428-1120(+)